MLLLHMCLEKRETREREKERKRKRERGEGRGEGGAGRGRERMREGGREDSLFKSTPGKQQSQALNCFNPRARFYLNCLVYGLRYGCSFLIFIQAIVQKVVLKK